MKRVEFLKSVVALSGGLAFAGCSKDFIDEVAGGEQLETLSVDEAQKWFSEVYLNKFPVSRTDEKGKEKYRRKANWDKANNRKDESKQDFVWVPVEYEDGLTPGVVITNKDTAIKQELSKYFVQPIVEGMVVSKKKGKTQAYLVQLVYDAKAVHQNGDQLDLTKFTGTLLRADWDDNVTDAIIFENGKKKEAYAAEGSENARIAGCFEIEVYYQTVGVKYNMDGTYEWTVTLHKVRRMSCTVGGTSSGTLGGGVSVNGGPVYGGSSGSSGVDIPNTEQVYLRPNYIVKDAIDRNGSQRALLNQRLDDFCRAMGPAISFADWTIAMGELVVKVVGAENLKAVWPVTKVAGRSVGIISVVMDGREVWIAFDESNMNWSRMSTWEQTKAVLLGAAAGAIIFDVFWLAVAASTVSVGIAAFKNLD